MHKREFDYHLSRVASRDILTTGQMRAAEAEAIVGGITGSRLMERAGRGAADCICERLDAEGYGLSAGAAPLVHILCGPGNNGGDGYVIARVLEDRGHAVTVYGLVPIARLSGDARAAADLWVGPVHPPERFLDVTRAPGQHHIVIDALFGIGLSRAMSGDAEKLIAAASEIASLVIAIDLPSGVASDTGEILGMALRADLTVTFHALKPGHVLPPGARHCGQVAVVDIGLGPQATTRARLTTDGPEIAINDGATLVADLGMDPDGHKYTKGHTVVLAGGLEGVGAARLAARAALRSGAGLVTIAVPPSALLAHAARGPDALIVRSCEGADGLATLLADRRRNAVVLGPALGVGEATRSAVAAVLKSDRPAVLDADALTSFAGDVGALAALTETTGNCVLTPHMGEFSNLFSEVRPDRIPSRPNKRSLANENPLVEAVFSTSSILHKALAAAALFGAVLVLKGPATIIAAPDGRAFINTNAPPWLGTAGSGDVLAGIIGSLLSQGLSPCDAACAGVWLHGEAGVLAGRGMISDDLPEALGRVLGAAMRQPLQK